MTAEMSNGKTNGASIPKENPTAAIVETDLLIIGAGPAGAGLACFLTQHGKPKCQMRMTSFECVSNVLQA